MSSDRAMQEQWVRRRDAQASAGFVSLAVMKDCMSSNARERALSRQRTDQPDAFVATPAPSAFALVMMSVAVLACGVVMGRLKGL